MIPRTAAAALLAGFGALSMMSTGASAFGGKSDNGDGYLNDAQKNPRYIEPYADADPSRYRVSNPRYGYDDRQRAAEFGYGRPAGRIVVQPYGYYRP